jgi:hypothetical protein
MNRVVCYVPLPRAVDQAAWKWLVAFCKEHNLWLLNTPLLLANGTVPPTFAEDAYVLKFTVVHSRILGHNGTCSLVHKRRDPKDAHVVESFEAFQAQATLWTLLFQAP